MHNSAHHFDSTDEEESLLPRRPMLDEARFDITAMIDLVFMMNIFFLVTTVVAGMSEIDLPAAKHCAPADRDTSVIFTLVVGADGNTLTYVGDGTAGEALTNPDAIERAVRAAVEAGVRAQKHTVLVKAAKTVRLRDLSRVATTAAGVPGTELKLAVLEME